mmetsp:Transcript_28128/g.89930  ORF Transcript_28128/g.89930 Transcript_28128/m.89930 type:complete len:224 (-) Transcript_28128:666-1337(-)
MRRRTVAALRRTGVGIGSARRSRARRSPTTDTASGTMRICPRRACSWERRACDSRTSWSRQIWTDPRAPRPASPWAATTPLRRNPTTWRSSCTSGRCSASSPPPRPWTFVAARRCVSATAACGASQGSSSLWPGAARARQSVPTPFPPGTAGLILPRAAPTGTASWQRSTPRRPWSTGSPSSFLHSWATCYGPPCLASTPLSAPRLRVAIWMRLGSTSFWAQP